MARLCKRDGFRKKKKGKARAKMQRERRVPCPPRHESCILIPQEWSRALCGRATRPTNKQCYLFSGISTHSQRSKRFREDGVCTEGRVSQFRTFRERRRRRIPFPSFPPSLPLFIPALFFFPLATFIFWQSDLSTAEMVFKQGGKVTRDRRITFSIRAKRYIYLIWIDQSTLSCVMDGLN